MERLQLYIAKPNQGLRTLLNINPRDDVWARAIDARSALEELAYDAAEKTVVYVLQYTAQGTFVTVVRTIPPTPLNYLGAWIFVPNGLKIEASKLGSLVRLVTRKISLPKFGEAEGAELREAFSQEYSFDEDSPRMAASRGLSYAAAAYGGDTPATLETYLGPCLFQPQWEPYKGVILMDDDLGLGCEAQIFEPSSLARTGALLPPSKDADTRGFTPCLYGAPLVSPTLVALDRETTVTWRRPGFEDVVQTLVVGEGGTVLEPPYEATSQAHKEIGPSSFYITSPITRKEITGCTIRVNGVDVSETPHAFEPDELNSAYVEVVCEGYFPYSSHLDLGSSTQALIQLKVTRRVYTFELPVKSLAYGPPVQFDISSRKTLEGSPIEGYILGDDQLHEGRGRLNRLVPEKGLTSAGSDRSFWYRTVWGAVGIVIGMVVMFFIMRPPAAPSSQKVRATSPKTEQGAPANTEVQSSPTDGPQKGAPAEAAPSGAVNQASLDYLAKTVWKKADMDGQPGLAGLYDDLNNFNLDRVINYWAPALKGSAPFAKVVKACRDSKRKGRDVHRQGHDVYTSSGSIKPTPYTYWIDP